MRSDRAGTVSVVEDDVVYSNAFHQVDQCGCSVFAALSVSSAEPIVVDTSQALGSIEYDEPLVRDVVCFDSDGDCYLVMTGSLSQNSTEKN